MASTLRFLQFFSLGTWVGSILFFSFVVTRGAFSVLPNNDLAGALVGYTLARLHLMGIVAGCIYLLATAANAGRGLYLEPAGSGRGLYLEPAGIRFVGALAHPAALLVVVMILCTTASQYGVIARMDVLRAQMGSVAATPAGSPLRVAFDRLHQYSVWLESVVLLSGLVALFLTARQKSS